MESFELMQRRICFSRNFLGYGVVSFFVGKCIWSCIILRLGVIGIKYTVKCGMWNVKMENGILRDNADFEYLISGEISKGTFNFCLCKI